MSFNANRRNQFIYGREKVFSLISLNLQCSVGFKLFSNFPNDAMNRIGFFLSFFLDFDYQKFDNTTTITGLIFYINIAKFKSRK